MSAMDDCCVMIALDIFAEATGSTGCKRTTLRLSKNNNKRRQHEDQGING
jgi:hypothetical protein